MYYHNYLKNMVSAKYMADLTKFKPKDNFN